MKMDMANEDQEVRSRGAIGDRVVQPIEDDEQRHGSSPGQFSTIMSQATARNPAVDDSHSRASTPSQLWPQYHPDAHSHPEDTLSLENDRGAQRSFSSPLPGTDHSLLGVDPNTRMIADATQPVSEPNGTLKATDSAPNASLGANPRPSEDAQQQVGQEDLTISRFPTHPKALQEPSLGMQLPLTFPSLTRDRGASTSSHKPIQNSGVLPLRSSSSVSDYRSMAKQPRHPLLLRSRFDRYHFRDSNLSLRRRDSPARHADNNNNNNNNNNNRGEAIRESMKSALTIGSSYIETSGTERSSVISKRSSTSDFVNVQTAEPDPKDEGMTVDDAIGMYENGFTDDASMYSAGGGSFGGGSGRPVSRNGGGGGGSNSAGLDPSVPDPKRLSTLSVPDPKRLSAVSAVTVHKASRDGSAAAAALLRPESPNIRPATAPATEPPTVNPSEQPPLPAPPPLLPVPSPPKQQQQQQSLPRRPVPTEARDRYGFKRATQHVTLEQYNTWEASYTEHLKRRKAKWIALLREYGLPVENPVRFPPKSAKVKRYVRKGIPPEWRGAAWFWYAGGFARLKRYPNRYRELVLMAKHGQMSDSDKELIERDLHRTFPDNVRFKPDASSSSSPPASPSNVTNGDSRNNGEVNNGETPVLQSLRRVLQAFSIQNPKIGYCQSLNFLAGLLLLFMEEEKAFWMLNIITDVYLPGTHEVNLEGANVDLGVLMISIRESMPSIWAKIGGELDGSSAGGRASTRLPPITLCTTAWFMSCYIGTLPIETVLRVWDSLFYEGSKTVFRIALAIFKVGEDDIKAVSDPMEIFQVVQTIPRRLIDASALMAACFKRRNGFGHISQETIEARRKERRALFAQERSRINSGGGVGIGAIDIPRENSDEGSLRHMFRRADSKVRLKKIHLRL
ncbi:RabGAP/TBC [Xylona heveae TC161]|uniref:RabGAP/TBC n=1 Tax=Xylona heveae (strain CBS 132557 / TC161) TaxID=1328760 RepID=A0A164ZYD2_XYLHT|nr:RabGAP/TBC [Xylona heveae TC161]KZF19696.1 RabGAP/TBC [Xylona heveae TC161]